MQIGFGGNVKTASFNDNENIVFTDQPISELVLEDWDYVSATTVAVAVTREGSVLRVNNWETNGAVLNVSGAVANGVLELNYNPDGGAGDSDGSNTLNNHVTATIPGVINGNWTGKAADPSSEE